MSNISMCRLCLAVDVRMHTVIDTPLQGIYEKITDISLSPHKLFSACYICYTQLKKCHSLIDRAKRAEQLFIELLGKGGDSTASEPQTLLTNYCISQIVCTSTVDSDSALKVQLKEEVKSEGEKEHVLISEADSDHQTTEYQPPSDSEENVPLKEINTKKRVEKNRNKVRKREVVRKRDGELSTPENQIYSCSTNCCISQIDTDAVDIDLSLKVSVKDEVKCENEKLRIGNADSNHQPTAECQPSSHSEDDVPLKKINTKKRAEKNRTKVRKREVVRKRDDKGFSAEFAKEIILSTEEQIQELRERAKSLNYLNSPLKCDLCFKGFVDSRAFENHKGKHAEKSGPHVCGVCQMRYISARQLRTHVATSHQRRFACYKCAHRSHTANQAREHEKWHSGFTYECKLCGQAFRKPTSYLTHMRKRHATQYVCDICGDSFVGRHGLLMHKSKTHRDDKVIENSTEPASDRYCSDCHVQFATLDAWKRHILSSANHTLAHEISLQCLICESRFTSDSGLRTHLRQHEKALRAARAPLAVKPAAELACDQCGSSFVNRSKLQAHIKRIHLGLKYNKNIVCEVCGKKCTSNASLKYHQRTHTGEKPFQCTSCSKRFADSNQLRIHTRTHTGERPYCCAACGKRFSQKPALNRHYRVHTGAKPYGCQYCSKTFSQSNSLKLHVRSVHLKMPPHRRHKDADVTLDKSEEPCS